MKRIAAITICLPIIISLFLLSCVETKKYISQYQKSYKSKKYIEFKKFIELNDPRTSGGIWIDESLWEYHDNSDAGTQIDSGFYYLPISNLEDKILILGIVSVMKIDFKTFKREPDFDYLKRLVLRFAEKNRENFKVELKETRIVNNNKVLYMMYRYKKKNSGEMMVSIGYYYIHKKKGVIFIDVVCPENSFSQYRMDMEDFLNGFAVAHRSPLFNKSISKNNNKILSKYIKSEFSNSLIKGKSVNYGIFYDANKWIKLDESIDPRAEYTFVHTKNDAFAFVEANRFQTKDDSVSLGAIKHTFLNHLKKTAQNVKITLSEKRMVNDIEIFCFKSELTQNNIEYVFLSYYYQGQKGIIVLNTMTSKNLFDEYESDLYDLLNGLVLGDQLNKFNAPSLANQNYSKSSEDISLSEPNKEITETLTGWYSRQYALVVGIDRYKNEQIVRLRNAENDAKAVANMFRGKGFQVTELYAESATKKSILSSFNKIQKSVSNNDSFIFYYAGHGHVIKLTTDEKIGYIIPYDANIALEENNIIEFEEDAIKLEELKIYSKSMKAKHVVLLLDSCFSGLAMKRSIGIVPTSKSIRYYNDLLNRRAINILTAGDDQPVSDGTGHSPFTKAILNGLDKNGLDINDRDGYATFTELAVYVKSKVEKATGRRQRPQFDNLTMEDGDFIFKLK